MVAVPIVIVCPEGGCTAPSRLTWLLHWPGLLALIGGFLIFIVAGWRWAYYW